MSERWLGVALIFALTLPSKGGAFAAELPDVSEVAGDTLTMLYEGPDARLMDFRFPPGVSLPDHSTGPRVVLIMTDGLIERTGGPDAGERTELIAGAALWLDGNVGSSFVNAGEDELRYLVYQPLDGFAQPQVCRPEFLISGEGEVRRLIESPLAVAWRVDVRGEAWIQLGDGTRRGLVVLGDGRVPVLIAGEVLRIEDGGALVFCHR